MAFAHCPGPIWQVDDFTSCFQQYFLKALFPLIIVGISLFFIVTQAIRRIIRSRKLAEHHVVDNNNTIFGAPGHQENGVVVEQYIAVVENLAIVGLVVANSVALLAVADGPGDSLASLAWLSTWLYVGILTSLQLALSNTFSEIRNHIATIYAFQWLFTLIMFRSALIHPRSRLAQILMIIEFSLSSLLFAITLTTRSGNNAVVLECDGDIQPSREPLASLFSIATFSWVDDIIREGYEKTLELGDVWNLVPEDMAVAILSDYRELKKTTKLTLHLLKCFRWTLFLQCSYAFLAALFTFAPTLLLKAILEYIENPGDTPRNVIWLYVILLAFTDIIRSFLDGQVHWIGRKAYIRLRVIIVGEIYAKTLLRKAATSKDTALGDKKCKGSGKKDDSNNNTFNPPDPLKGVPEKNSSDEQANVGTINNLMSVDSAKVAGISGSLHFLISYTPTQLAVCIVLLYRILGLSCIPSLVVIILLLPINIVFPMSFRWAQKKILAATDKRIQTTNEIFQNIRFIKLCAWENSFSNIVNKSRTAELKALRGKYVLRAFYVAVYKMVPIIITSFSFLVYTMVERKPLYPSVAFTAILLFNLLRAPLDTLGDMVVRVQASAVSINRVEKFLNEEGTDKYEQLHHNNIDEDGNKMIGFKDGSFSWGAEDGNTAFRLMNVNIKFAIGKLNVVAGPTGSGKTSLLMALLGEMTRIKGEVFLPGGYNREDVRPDPVTNLTETVAYCAQQPWLVNANIKENILFATRMDEQRYKDVIVACALEWDLEVLDAGDETLVGEKGITLSGGQKQRISLARALYSKSRHVLLDDCLSAVDFHTAKWIFDKCITGPLMHNRTCILVTHNIALCVPFSEHVVVLENGRISVQGTPTEVMTSGQLGEEVTKTEIDSGKASRIPSHMPSDMGNEGPEGDGDKLNDAIKSIKPNVLNKRSLKDAMSESKADGGAKLSVLILYLKSMGPWWFWVMTILLFGVQLLAALAANFWVKQWANQYNVGEGIHLSSSSYDGNLVSISYMTDGARISKIIPYINPTKTTMLSPDINIKYYLMVYALIGICQVAVSFFRVIWLFYGSLTASSIIHPQLMESVIRAKFNFFDVTPLGQIMNRFSKDLESIDQDAAPAVLSVMGRAQAILTSVVLISSITPGFLIVACFISIMYFLVGKFYIRSSRDLKRLESVQRSPLFQQFGETLTGITTIRAYGDEKRFIRDMMSRVNDHNRPFIFSSATYRWLAFRIDIIGDLVAFFAGIFVILNLGSIDAGSAGLMLSYAVSFTDNVLWLVKSYATYEQNMNSVERIKEYLGTEQEADAIVENGRPGANWPRAGAVEFINYTTRYRLGPKPALRGVNFKIYPGEKVGIVGRTGAGKSSLALALFRGLEAEEGKILIDGVDIGLIGLQDLRESITIVPQDPTLFTGTIRSNLDPFNLSTDEEVFTVLRRVRLIGVPCSVPVPSTPTHDSIPVTSEAESNMASPTGTSNSTNKNIFLNLSSTVAESGNNLSQGQRQLLCLARALLKNPKVLMMDEATASIDYTTDSKIQETIRELKSTIITIAHRLQTIVDFDKVLVLKDGQVVEYGHPHELLIKEGKKAFFKEICKSSGDFDALGSAARKAFQAKRLIDDE